MNATATQNTIRGRSKVVRHTRTGARGPVVRLATASVLAGLAVTAAAGTAAAAPAAPLPAFTDGSAGLAELLLSGREAANVLGSDRLTEQRTAYRLGNTSGSIQPSICVPAAKPAQAIAYVTAEPVEVAVKVLTDGGNSEQGLVEAVVELPSKPDALAQMKAIADNWADCGGLTLTQQSQSSEDSFQWKLGKPMINKERSIVTLSQTALDGSGITCERAIGAHRAILVDVLACTHGDATGQGLAAVKAIGAKADTSPV
ncbi:hypothetical protein A7U43_28520 (plasmid) [Mycobacterium adipatum]|uniref:PknH-like extracellular domain-containing protein n=1 Tax=Mycobacterium adipatum TaxID=1682113 RepID=A0A172UWW0_9MYCO|nr:sensor domain-containing protein [Mycobacterium adipatum]ANE83458.1 hypothetical protein A7U43_28520 [Mycobacterium adipatum]